MRTMNVVNPGASLTTTGNNIDSGKRVLLQHNHAGGNAHLVTIKNAGGDTLGSMYVAPHRPVIVDKEPTDTVETEASVTDIYATSVAHMGDIMRTYGEIKHLAEAVLAEKEQQEEKKFCKLCQKPETREECSYGPKAWDRFAVPVRSVKKEELELDEAILPEKKERKSRTKKGRKSYERENPGSDLRHLQRKLGTSKERENERYEEETDF